MGIQGVGKSSERSAASCICQGFLLKGMAARWLGGRSARRQLWGCLSAGHDLKIGTELHQHGLQLVNHGPFTNQLDLAALNELIKSG